jgi:CrcB protein
VNLTGSLLLGFYLARRERTVTAAWSLPFWGIGVFGSLTTFSAFSIEVVLLIQDGHVVTAGSYVALSIVGGSVLSLSGQRIGSAT